MEKGRANLSRLPEAPIAKVIKDILGLWEVDCGIAAVYQTLLTIGRRNGTVVRCVPSLLSFQPCSLRRRRQRKIRFPFLPTMAESFSPISTERVTERSCLRTRALQQRELDDAG